MIISRLPNELTVTSFYLNNPRLLPLKNSPYLISQHYFVLKSATGCQRIYFYFQEYSELYIRSRALIFLICSRD